jgi:Protein of unknown function (DUF3987)
MKTPAIQEPLKPLKRLEIDAKREFDAAMKEFEAKQLVSEQRKAVAKTEIKNALKEAGGEALDIAREALAHDDKSPTRRRFMVNDSTVEKLGEILNENPNGILCYRDELIGLLKSLEKEGQEGARSFYLEAWNGTGRYTYDRIGRGTVDIEAAIVSLIGSIQPGPLRAYLRGAISDGAGADGLMQRFQLAVYPDISPTWRNVDRWPDTDAKNRAYDVICALDRLGPLEVGAEVDSDEIPFLRFDEEAQERFDEWRGHLEHRLRSAVEHPVIIAHLAKYRSLIPSLALLCHLADGCTGPVGSGSLARAIAWGSYLETHARRVYAAAVTPDSVEAIGVGQEDRIRRTSRRVRPARHLPEPLGRLEHARRGTAGGRGAAGRGLAGPPRRADRWPSADPLRGQPASRPEGSQVTKVPKATQGEPRTSFCHFCHLACMGNSVFHWVNRRPPSARHQG